MGWWHHASSVGMSWIARLANAELTERDYPGDNSHNHHHQRNNNLIIKNEKFYKKRI